MAYNTVKLINIQITEKNYVATRTTLEQNGAKFETLVLKKEE
jgi:hypothetical protein